MHHRLGHLLPLLAVLGLTTAEAVPTYAHEDPRSAPTALPLTEVAERARHASQHGPVLADAPHWTEELPLPPWVGDPARALDRFEPALPAEELGALLE